MTFDVRLLMSEFVTHDVRRFVVTRPQGFDYQPGQGVELSIQEPGWEQEARPFTPTSLKDDGVLEFTIKGYADHDGVTRKLHTLRAGAELKMSEPFGVLTYKGPGWFIAGGAGITPMLAMLRHLEEQDALNGHGLIFANRGPEDIICERELKHALGDRCLFVCDDARGQGYLEGRVDADFLARHVSNFDQHFYTCGPPGFDKGVRAALAELGAKPDRLIFET